MIAKLLLTMALSGAWLYVLIQSGISKLIRFVLYSVIAGGIYFVWFPDQASVVANALGIGRGADLIVYTWIILSFVVLINIHLKLRKNLNLLTQLARHLAMTHPYIAPSSVTTRLEAELGGVCDAKKNGDLPQGTE